MERTGMRFGVIGLAAMMGLSLLVGGCSRVSKKDYELAKSESTELREQNAQLDQQNRDLASRMSQLEADRAQQLAAAQQPAATGWSGGGDSASSGGGGGPTNFTEDSSGNMVAELAGDVTFNSGQATLTSAAKKKLDRIAGELNSRYARRSVRVEGHTDSQKITKSKWASNDALSQARAESVEKYLSGKGVSGGRISAVGYGSSQPKGSMAASRRVEIVITN